MSMGGGGGGPVQEAKKVVQKAVTEPVRVTQAALEGEDVWSGSDLQAVTTNPGEVINDLYQGSDVDKTFEGIQNALFPTGDNTDDLDAEIDYVENTPVPVPTTAQPMVGGDMSNAALQEQALPGTNIRQDMMNPLSGGRRKTMLTIGQSASKINARRIG